MRTSIKYYLLITGLSILPLISIFVTPQLFHSHDGYVHLARIAAYYKALKDGEFPIRWAGDLNYGYGMPLFNFIYQVPYFLAALVLKLGFHLVTAFKITISLSYLLAGIFMFAFSKDFFEDNKKAFLISVFYQFAPFRLVELLVRGSFGEVYTYAFLPLVLLGIVKFFKTQSYRNFFIISIATALLILSHNALSLVFFGICFGFILLFSPNKMSLLKTSLSLCIGLALASFYWIPAIIEHKYTYGDLFMRDLYLDHFPQIQNFFIPNFFNDIHLQTKGISVQFGIFHVIAILVTVFIFVKKKVLKQIDKTEKKLFIVSMAGILITLFFMQPASKFLWAHISLLRQFQFSWRLLGIISFFTSLLSVCFFTFSFFRNKWVYIVTVFLVVFSTAYYWKPPLGYNKIDEGYYWNYPLTSTYFGETDVIWSEGPAKAYPKERIEVIDGKGKLSHFSRKTNQQNFHFTAEKDSKLVDHLEYFPGWRVYINNISVPIQFQYGNYRGQIIFQVPKGENDIQVIFGESRIRFIADMLSLIALLSLFLIGLLRKKLFFITKKENKK